MPHPDYPKHEASLIVEGNLDTAFQILLRRGDRAGSAGEWVQIELGLSTAGIYYQAFLETSRRGAEMSEQVAVQADVNLALTKVEGVKNVLGQVHSFAKRERLTALWDATHRGLGDLESLEEFLRARQSSESPGASP